jgi:hypothetical protein
MLVTSEVYATTGPYCEVVDGCHVLMAYLMTPLCPAKRYDVSLAFRWNSNIAVSVQRSAMHLHQESGSSHALSGSFP